jgi:tRNA(Arg) A34 adenosine deaminase TadA
VNPATGQVIARSADYYATLHRRRPGRSTLSAETSPSVVNESKSGSAALYNPLNTPTMRCIEMVAAVVRGEMQFPAPSQSAGTGTGTCVQFPSNASNELASSKVGAVHGGTQLSAAHELPSAQKPLKLSASREANLQSPEEEEEDAYSQFVEDQYLCTDLDLYLQLEPDTMAAMALVHSRIRRVYFLEAHADGAITTRLHLHVMRQLNHRYRAFHCIEQEKEQ